ncbi:Conidiation protein 6-domain-containing protein [Hypoxylon trugodes]|uniref:Conidiation protein 6-domain-containing protein n=1 Tax=Hypoxylon trugodes TaxID=326681 RepID=UPI00218DD0DB|nr:Conidiation protein 6-domain-containing protein [Hypoxylon trugodes]KAI1387655.1 Conidiation protein 6-domain-containing protein [Hypoxylon trugodes]
MTDQDNYSDIQQEVPASADIEPDPENVYRGHKATLSNPNTSKAAKDHSRQVLENETDEPVDASNNIHGVHGSGNSQDEQKDPGNIARGLKASISNQNVSDEARERAREKLRELEG